MAEVKLTKEQEILFEVYEKGVQNEDCDLDAYVEKMKQALSLSVVLGQSEQFCKCKQPDDRSDYEIDRNCFKCGKPIAN